MFTSDPFRLVPISNIAEIADKFTRNEIMTPNEVRSIVGFKPNDDPQADELRNRNINQNGSQEESKAISKIPAEIQKLIGLDKQAGEEKQIDDS